MADLLTLDVWLESFPMPIGKLRATDTGNTEFQYEQAYLDRSDAIPVSMSMALQENTFGDQLARAYFNNLLQENNRLEDVMTRYGIERGDVVGLLYHLGADCPGAISCVPEGAGPTKTPGNIETDYEKISDEVLRELVIALADNKPLPGILRDPSPIAGAQPKIAITYLGSDKGYFVPKPGFKVPTTHIMKVPRRADSAEVALEREAMTLAAAVGIPAAKVEQYQIDDIPFLLIHRFDRIITAEGRVYRVHQEDMAQAAGLPSRLKYEKDGVPPDRIFNANTIARILKGMSGGARTVERFLTLTFFNLAVGNTDNHAKNHGLIYQDGPSPSPSPAYDILPILLLDGVHHDMAFSIGKKINPYEITKEDFYRFLEIFGLEGKSADRFFKKQLEPLLRKIEENCQSLNPTQKRFYDLIGKRISHISKELGLEVEVANRDYVPEGFRVGGWALTS